MAVAAFALLLLLALASTSEEEPREVRTTYLREGRVVSENVRADCFDSQGGVNSPYLTSVEFTHLDTVSFTDGDPDRIEYHGEQIPLDFTRTPIQAYSPEYYAVFTVHHINRCADHYGTLFGGKIDFTSEEEYRSIKISLGDCPFLMGPNHFIFTPSSDPSPSIIYHEVGHLAFWLLEESLGVRFGGNTLVHMGLLEYFSASLNDSPVVGEGVLPPLLVRDLSKPARFPLDRSYTLEHSDKLLAQSYPEIASRPDSNAARYYQVSLAAYSGRSTGITDNHRGAMVVAHPLWQIRQQVGQTDTDQLVATTTLHLNQYMAERDEFYVKAADEACPEQIAWYDLVHGLVQTDRTLNRGEHVELLRKAFEDNGFPVFRVQN